MAPTQRGWIALVLSSLAFYRLRRLGLTVGLGRLAGRPETPPQVRLMRGRLTLKSLFFRVPQPFALDHMLWADVAADLLASLGIVRKSI